jgi:hypothetical protein
MKKLSFLTLLGLVLVVAAGAFSVQAAPPMPTATPEPVIRPSFTDGRINAYDPGAPVAVFETRKTVPIVNDNGVPTTAEVVNGVQLLFWDGASAKEVLNVSAADIEAAIKKLNSTKSTTVNNSTATTSSASPTAVSSPSTNTITNASATKNFTIAGNSVVISKVNGYTLNYSKDGFLWITTPPNFEGKVYTFSWQKDF